MSDFLGKLSSYSLFNYLFSGVLFVILAKYFTPYSFIQSDLVLGVFLYYFIGLVVSRIGSLLIEPILKKTSFLHFADYHDFVRASKADPGLDVLSEVNNTYRTLAAVFVSLIFLKLYQLVSLKFIFLQTIQSYALILFLLLMFLFAYRKQTGYIRKRIASVNSK